MSRQSRFVGLCLVAACLAAPLRGDEASSLEPLKEQADAAYRKRDFPTTISLSNRVLTSSPQDHVALYLRGSARVEMGIVTGHLQMIREGISDAREAIRHEGNGKPEYYLPYIYGMSHLSLIEGKPAHARTAQSVADSILDREDLTSEQRANLLYQRAQTNVHLKDFRAAEGDLREALQHSPQHLAAHMLVAEIAARTRTPEEAVAAYTRIVEAFPDNPLTYNNRGMFLQSQGKTQEAVADFNKAIQIDAQFVPAYINRGFAYLEGGDSARAEVALTEALRVDGSQAGAISLRATARLNQNKAQEALADYRKVVELAPQNPMSHADLGFAQFFLGDFSGAHKSFQSAMELNPQMRFLLPWRLACEIRLGQIQQELYQPTVAKAEAGRDWVDQLVLFQLGKVDAASLLNSVSQTDQQARTAQLCEGYYFIGMELQRRNRVNDAMAYWQQAAQRKLPKLSAYRGAVFALQNTGSTTR